MLIFAVVFFFIFRLIFRPICRGVRAFGRYACFIHLQLKGTGGFGDRDVHWFAVGVLEIPLTMTVGTCHLAYRTAECFNRVITLCRNIWCINYRITTFQHDTFWEWNHIINNSWDIADELILLIFLLKIDFGYDYCTKLLKISNNSIHLNQGSKLRPTGHIRPTSVYNLIQSIK